MTTTYCIDANRSISKYNDENKLRWVNTLDGGLQLRKGDVVSMASAQINQRGANVSTISIPEDITETLNFCYYITDNDSFFAGDDGANTKLYRDGYTRGGGLELTKIGYTNTPYYYWGNFADDLELLCGQQTIFIPAGSYSPDNLATMISEQFAGRQTSGKDPFDYLRDDNLRENSEYPGLCNTDSECMIAIPTDDLTLSDADGDSNMFLQMKISKDIVEDQITDGNAVTKAIMLGLDEHWISTQTFTDDSSATKHDFVNQAQFLGAVPTLQWDAQKSRFTINNLHAPYRIPNYPDPTKDDPSENRGEEATVFNRNAIQFGVYPKSAIGGIAVTNPAWLYCSVNSAIGKDIVDKMENGSDTEKRQARTKRTTYKFNEYWASNEIALQEWRKTIWSRLGFEMTQWTDDSKWLSFFPLEDIAYDDGEYSLKPGVDKTTALMGISTTQELTTDMAMTSGGLSSVHHGESGKGFYNQCYNYETPGLTFNTHANPGGEVTPPETYEMLSNGLPLTARRLPQLADSPYYNIWSDIIDSSNWYSNKGNRNTLVGQCNKNYSASDFLYQYDSGIEFTITKDRVLTEVTTAVLLPNDKSPNPDLFDENCAVLYKIVRYDSTPQPTTTKTIEPQQKKKQPLEPVDNTQNKTADHK
jgi:hypothetical protein|tara:strand:- start:5038 stop:6972 length:1935 start_codon:yes stop_codon:yes gene_type:complete